MFADRDFRTENLFLSMPTLNPSNFQRPSAFPDLFCATTCTFLIAAFRTVFQGFPCVVKFTVIIIIGVTVTCCFVLYIYCLLIPAILYLLDIPSFFNFNSNLGL